MMQGQEKFAFLPIVSFLISQHGPLGSQSLPAPDGTCATGAKLVSDGRGNNERRGTMSCLTRPWAVCILGGLLFIAVANSRLTADDGAASVNTKTIDQNLHLALREVINQGADIFNQGDTSGCYRLFQGALITARGQLGHHSDVQKLIDEGLARNDQGTMGRRAWALRRLLDDVRDKINPNPKKSAEKSKPSETQPGKAPEKKSSETKPPGKKSDVMKSAPVKPLSLWDRLGGEPSVTKVVDDWFTFVQEDKIDVTRGGKFKLDDAKAAELKKSIVAYVSSVSGGPIPYKGKTMKETHQGMAITNIEFDAFVQTLVKALKKNNVKQADADDLIRIVNSTRKDIVEMKTDGKKPDDGKPDEKKPQDKSKLK